MYNLWMSSSLESLPLFIFVLTLTYKKKKRKALKKKKKPQQQKEYFDVGEGMVRQPISHIMVWGLGPGMAVAHRSSSWGAQGKTCIMFIRPSGCSTLGS